MPSYLSNSIQQDVADPVWREQRRAELLTRDTNRRHANAPIAHTTPLFDIPVYFEDATADQPEPAHTSERVTVHVAPELADDELRAEDALRLWDKLRASEPATLRLVHERQVARLTGLPARKVAAIIAEHRPVSTKRAAVYQAEDARRARILQEYRELCLTQPTTPEPKHRETVCAKHGVVRATFGNWLHRIKIGKWDALGQPIEAKSC